MPPDINRNEPEPCPERIFPRMPRLMEPIIHPPPRAQQAQNRNRNQAAGPNNNNEERDEAQRRRLPFIFRLIIGPQIARYLRMRRAMNDARDQNVNGNALPPTNGSGPNPNGQSTFGSGAATSGAGPSTSGSGLSRQN
ncbi:hypothetical protein CRE_00902 [Caenorhabditis remanei]|uniref:Uncharacterized protein n=1 Tax=Caenorhabditis remanei TaxID=31234 RepID=E3LCF4_CAERE|nr:hypothetical protein CRE_00902 [Caenorhabditis remanei]